MKWIHWTGLRYWLWLLLCFCPMSVVAQRLSSDQVTQKFGQLMHYLQQYYIDTLDQEALLDEAIKAVLKQLDPHTSYITADDLASMNEPLLGEFAGIGIEFSIVADTLVVQATVAGGPAEKVGILPGDCLIAVDGIPISGPGLTVKRVHDCLRGPVGSAVSVTVLRSSQTNPLEFLLQRDKIPLHSLDAAYLTADQVLYLRLSRFAATTGKELRTALAAYPQKKGVILDLRGNGGGYLHAALQVANEFLTKGSLILYTSGRSVEPIQEYANGHGLYQQGPMALLVDANTASSSEIVVGALQDWGRAIVIGQRTYGKGLVQRPFSLLDGSQVRVTVAQYHTPCGRVLQRPYAAAYQSDTLRFSGDSLYGICPDVVIEEDTSFISTYYINLVHQGVLQEFVTREVNLHRSTWQEQYPTVEDFLMDFVVTDDCLQGLITLAQSKAIRADDNAWEQSVRMIKIQIKALSARILFDSAAYYRVLQTYSDPVFEAACLAVSAF
ncbi:MAG: S41 family peptidase [Bacteroidales bacterium]|nr:S41 family peptidase [Bacteroidales bacterium]